MSKQHEAPVHDIIDLIFGGSWFVCAPGNYIVPAEVYYEVVKFFTSCNSRKGSR